MASDAVGESQLACDVSFLIVNDPTVRADADYADVPGLFHEARSKLEAARPRTVGQAGPLDGLRRLRSASWRPICDARRDGRIRWLRRNVFHVKQRSRFS